LPSQILVAIDGSKHSERIVHYAADLAKKISAGVALLYVTPEEPIPEGFKEYAKTENMSESDYYDAVGTKVLEKYWGVLTDAGVECETVTEAGNAAENILIVAKDLKSDIIIVGLQGLHGLAKIRSLGSVARRVIENATIPVIMVP
jgi:nucleotide-binding universal stress UspA family protein